jgi:hypothetical protein
MLRQAWLTSAIALLGCWLTSAAGAAPLARSDTSHHVGVRLPVINVHGCHFDLGPNMAPDHVNGTHYHDNQCRAVRVGPPRGYTERDYYDEPRQRGYRPDYDDRPRRRGGYYDYQPPPQPVCYERCRYVGPIKRCRTVCE